MKKKCRGCSSL